ncbi:MAG: type II toxin-antitoxin system VapC family toxin [Thermoproteota archaeon]
MVCLDTSVLIALIRNEDNTMRRLRMEAERGTRICTTPLNLCELYAGAYASRDQAKELRRVRGLQEVVTVLEFQAEACKKYGELVNDPALRKRPVSDFDLIIASISISHGESLATRNVEHFQRIPELTVERW